METINFDDAAFDSAFDKNADNLNSQLNETIIIAMVGDVNAGKSSTINRIMEEDLANVGAKPGETVQITEYPYKENIIFADTPGLNDVNNENSEVTKKYYKKCDAILFFLNAAGTVLSDIELENLHEIEKVNKDILIVLNKIDAADDIPGIIEYIKDKTNNLYPIIPVSSRTGENIELLQNALLDLLEKKSKNIPMAKNMSNKSSIANRWILGAGASSAAIGATPIPGADFIPLTSIQIGLMIKLSILYEKPLTKDNAKELIISTIAGNIGKTIFRQVSKFIPGAGSIIGASVAGATTIALGYAIKYAHENKIELNAEALKSLYEMFLKKEKSNN